MVFLLPSSGDDDQPDDEENVNYEEDGEKEEGAMYRRHINSMCIGFLPYDMSFLWVFRLRG